MWLCVAVCGSVCVCVCVCVSLSLSLMPTSLGGLVSGGTAGPVAVDDTAVLVGSLMVVAMGTLGKWEVGKGASGVFVHGGRRDGQCTKEGRAGDAIRVRWQRECDGDEKYN